MSHVIHAAELVLPTSKRANRRRIRRDMARAERVALMTFDLARGRSITSRSVVARFGVSLTTAKRDVALLARVFLGERLDQGYHQRRELRLPKGGSI